MRSRRKMTFVVIEAINKFIGQSSMNVNAYFTGVVMLSANMAQSDLTKYEYNWTCM